jgi:hypothetical protein
MSTYDKVLKWVSKGQCENKSDRPIKVCIDGKPFKLDPGARTPENKDCDGIIHEDGSATKIYGESGIEERKSKEWVEKHWPACSEKSSKTEKVEQPKDTQSKPDHKPSERPERPERPEREPRAPMGAGPIKDL